MVGMDEKRGSEDLMASLFGMPGTSLKIGKEEIRATLRPTVIVGLGGTGQTIVSRVKERILTYQGADSLIKFVVFDTAQKDHESSLDDQEFCYMGDFDGDDVIKRLHTSPDIAAWIPHNLRPGFVRDGAHQVRPVGRLALFWNFIKVRDYLRKAVADSMAIFNRRLGEVAEGRTVKVYIVSSLCGGHGSGTFLDTAYYLRHLIHNEFTARPFVSGIFMMPEPFMSRVLAIQNQERLRANTYAALKEMEHFIDTRDFYCKYPAQPPIRVQSVPFDAVHLIDDVNEAAQVVREIDDLFSMIAVQMYLELVTPLGGEQTNSFDNLVLEPHEATGKPKAFASFAVGALQFPVDKIHHHLAFRAGKELIENGILVLPDERTVEGMVISFVTQMKIREHEANDVVDALNLTPRGRRAVVPLDDSAIDVDASGLLAQVNNLENTLMPQRLEQAKQTMEETKDVLLNEVLEGLRAQLRTTVHTRGLSFTRRFVERLRQEVTLYKSEMDEEREDAQAIVETYRRRIGALVSLLPDVLRAGFLVRGGRIGRWKAEYLPARRLLNKAVLEEANRGLASSLFTRLDSELENGLTRLRVLIGQMEDIRDRFRLAADQYGPRRVDEGMRFEVVKEVMTRDDVNRYYDRDRTTLAEFVGQTDVLTQWVDSDAELTDARRPRTQRRQGRRVLALAQQVFDYCYEKYSYLRDTDSYNILEFLMSSKSILSPQDEVRALLARCQPFWSWNDAMLGAGERNLPHQFVLGLFSASDPGWTSDLIPEMASRPVLVSTGNPHVIMASKVAYGLPLFALNRIESYGFYYQRYLDDPRRPLHLEDDWANWPDLLAQVGQYQDELLFALAIAYNLVYDRGAVYFYRRADTGEEATLERGREKAVEAFLKPDRAMLRQTVRGYIDRHRRQHGESAIQNDLREYVREEEAKLAERPPGSVGQQIRKELRLIKDFLKNEYGIDLDLEK